MNKSKISVQDLNLFYGNFQALYDVNLEIPANMVTAFIGPSGCGKSTLLKTFNRMNDLVVGCRTELGSAIRSTGDNAAMSRAQGINTDSMQILALMIANALVAMSGSLVMQQQRFGDVSMGIGTIVIGLASIIIGEVIFGKRFGFWWSLLSVVFGSVIYRLIIALVLQLGMKTQDLKLLSAVVVAIALSVPVLKQKASRCKKISVEAKNA